MNFHLVNRMGAWLAAACLCVSLTGIATAQTPASPKANAKQKRSAGSAADAKVRSSEPAPTRENVSYGPDAGNKIDFWKAGSTDAAPLVVFIHGGGFRAGDKSAYDKPLLTACQASGISYASINYRLSDVAPYPAQMHDSAR